MKANRSFSALGLIIVLLLTAFCILPTTAQAKTKVVWWHAHTGNIGERLNGYRQEV